MKRKIQIRRGLAADRPTLAIGEFGLDTDTNEVWIGTASGNILALQQLGADLTAIEALTPTNNDVLQRKSGAWTNRTLAQLKNDLAIPQQVSACMTGALSGNAVRFAPLFYTGASANEWLGLDLQRTVIINACTIDKLYVDTYTKTGAGACDVTLLKNGVTTALTAVCTNGTITSDLTHSVSFVAGDNVSWQISAVATSTVTNVSISARLTPTF